MKVKKFVANTMPEAMKEIRKELGIDAIILHSKEIQTGGFLGYFTKRAFEVTAAVDPTPSKVNSKSIRATDKQETFDLSLDKPLNLESSPRKQSETYQGLAVHLEQLSKSVETLRQSKHFPASRVPPLIADVANYFLAQDVKEEIVERITRELLNLWYRHENIEEHPNQKQLVQEWTENVLRDLLVDQPVSIPKFDTKVISLVGPTGVGKTTTLAKLAATASLEHQKKVAFLTTDTYRIAAIEQLKIYAEIISVPVKVAYNLEDFKTTIMEYAKYDLVFVDTAGRNFLERFYVDELENMIDFNEQMKTYLVMSLTAKYTDMQAIYDQFSSLPIKQIIFTKKDETSTYGNMLNMIIQNKVGVAFLTTGQNVPDDIQSIEKEEIIKMFSKDLFHE